MPDVVHVCTRAGRTRATALCGLCSAPCIPLCGWCGHDLTSPGHEDH